MAVDAFYIESIQNEQDYISRKEAVQQLGIINNPEAIELLLTALQDPYFKIREEAARALGAYIDPRVIEPLMGALLDTPSVRTAAKESLLRVSPTAEIRKRIQTLEDHDAVRKHRNAVRSEQRFGPPIDYVGIHEACASEDYAVREVAVSALNGSSNPASLPILINALHDDILFVREAAARIVLSYTGPVSFDALEPLLQTGNAFVFDTLIRLLQARSVSDLPERLIDLLQHSRITTRRRARCVLQNLAISTEAHTLTHSLEQWDNRDRFVLAYLATKFYKEGDAHKSTLLGKAIQGCLGDVLTRDWLAGLDALRQLDVLKEYRHLAFFCTSKFDKFDVNDLKLVLNQSYENMARKALLADFLCTEHLTRFSQYTERGFNYAGCRICGQSHWSISAPICIVRLDDEMHDNFEHVGNTYRVNWLSNRYPFDFDRVEIGACSEDTIVDFCIVMGNDTDSARSKRLRRTPCNLLPDARVSREIRNLLEERFDDITTEE